MNYKWKTPIGEGYAGPAVVGDRAFVTDRQFGRGQSNNLDDPYDKSPIGGTERVLCLAADSGKVLWQHEYSCRYTISFATGPRATPTVHEGKLYSTTATSTVSAAMASFCECQPCQKGPRHPFSGPS